MTAGDVDNGAIAPERHVECRERARGKVHVAIEVCRQQLRLLAPCVVEGQESQPRGQSAEF